MNFKASSFCVSQYGHFHGNGATTSNCLVVLMAVICNQYLSQKKKIPDVGLNVHDNTPPLRTNHRVLYPLATLVYLLRYPFNTGGSVRGAGLAIRVLS